MNISEPNNQTLVVSIVKAIRNERERSISPDWVMYPDAEAHQKDEAESSNQQSSNIEILKKMKRLEQEMLERDIQLKAQLEKRDQYFEEEIRKIDLFMDEAIK